MLLQIEMARSCRHDLRGKPSPTVCEGNAPFSYTCHVLSICMPEEKVYNITRHINRIAPLDLGPAVK